MLYNVHNSHSIKKELMSSIEYVDLSLASVGVNTIFLSNKPVFRHNASLLFLPCLFVTLRHDLRPA